MSDVGREVADLDVPTTHHATLRSRLQARRPGSAHDCGVSDPQTQRGRRDVARALRALHEVTNCVAAWNDEDALARAPTCSIALGTRRSGRSAARPADHRQGLDRRRRFAVYRRVRAVSRSDARGRRHGRGADARGRRDRARQDDGVRGHRDLRAGPQPTRSDASPGGSSSGAAAAVAGGGCPLALGSDSGGSIRLRPRGAARRPSSRRPDSCRRPATSHASASAATGAR